MPFARRPPVLDAQIAVLDGVPIKEGVSILRNQAVCVVGDGAGGRHYDLCGALPADNPDAFYGFMGVSISEGVVRVYVGRGTLIKAVVEGGADLVPDEPVFLSTEPGSVVQPAPTVAGAQIIRLGVAVDTERFVFSTDQRILL